MIFCILMNCCRHMASVSATQFIVLLLRSLSRSGRNKYIPPLIATAHWQMQTYDAFQNVHWQLSRGLISRIFHDGRRQRFHFKAFISRWHGAWWTQVIWGAGVKRKGAPTCKVKQSWTHPNILVKTKTLLLCDSDVITLCNAPISTWHHVLSTERDFSSGRGTLGHFITFHLSQRQPRLHFLGNSFKHGDTRGVIAPRRPSIESTSCADIIMHPHFLLVVEYFNSVLLILLLN